MHYANGRPAKNGDRVLQIQYGSVVIGVLYDAKPGIEHCNGSLAPVFSGGSACLSDCLRLDDVLAALGVDLSPNSAQDVRKQLSLVTPTKEI